MPGKHPLPIDSPRLIIRQNIMNASNVGLAPQHILNQIFNTIQTQPIVGIKKKDIFPLSNRQSGIPRRRQTAVDFVNHFNPAVKHGIIFKNVFATVRRTVIDTDNFQIAVCLMNDRFQTIRQKLFNFVNGNDN